MPKMIILRGVSGSGKSTWARQHIGYLIVSRDSIRLAMYGSDGPDYYKVDKSILSAREQAVTLAEDGMITAFLRGGHDVIVDNTNIEWKYVMGHVKRARKLGAEVEIKTFDVPLADAIQRDYNRGVNGGRAVGREVIIRQHQRFQGSKDNTIEPAFAPTPYNGTPGKPKAFLVDIDGTLAHMRDYRKPYDWKKVHLDDVDEVIADIVYRPRFGSLGNEDYDMTCIVMSGRDESCRELTEEWLNNHNIWGDVLYMRPAGDMRPDNIVKAELFDKYVRDNYDVQFVLDDRQQVVDMWRSMGLTCLQVAPGDF